MSPALRRLSGGFGEPLLLLILAIGGLVAALLGVGVLKWVGVLAASAPVGAILRHLVRARRAPSGRKSP